MHPISRTLPNHKLPGCRSFNWVNVCATAPLHNTATAPMQQQGNRTAEFCTRVPLIPDSHWCTTLLSRHPCFPSTGLYHTADLSPTMWLWHWSRMWTTAILNLYCLSKVANICLGTPRLLKREFPPPLKKTSQQWKQTILWRFKQLIYKTSISTVTLLCSFTAHSEQILFMQLKCKKSWLRCPRVEFASHLIPQVLLIHSWFSEKIKNSACNSMPYCHILSTICNILTE